MREKLYARQIERRQMTILDVPEKYRDKVMALLTDSDRLRMQKLLGG